MPELVSAYYCQMMSKQVKTDFLFINPPYCSDGCYAKTIASMIPIHLITMNTALRKASFESNLLDLVITNNKTESFRKFLEEKKPTYVGFSNHTMINLDEIERLAKIAKEHGAKVLLGGINPTHIKSEVFKYTPSVDHLFLGFSEYSLLHFLKIKNKPRVIDSNENNFSDSLPDIGSIPNLDCYTSGLYPLESQRGCEFNCAFCTSKMRFGKRPIRKPIKQIIHEIKRAARFGFKEFFFTDNTLTGDKKYILSLMEDVKEEKIKSSFIAMTRFDCLDEEILKKMREAGVSSLGLGFESASLNVLKKYGKRLSHSSTEEILGKIVNHGIETTAFIMTGGPDDSDESLNATFKELERLRNCGVLQWITVSMFRPFPGTAYWKTPKRFNIKFEKSYSAFHNWGFFNGKAVTAVKELSKEKIEYWTKKINSLNPQPPKLQI